MSAYAAHGVAARSAIARRAWGVLTKSIAVSVSGYKLLNLDVPGEPMLFYFLLSLLGLPLAVAVGNRIRI